MNRLHLPLTAALVLFATGAWGGSPPISVAAEAEVATGAELLAKLHQANQMEIEMGKLAKNQSDAREVRAFGDRLIRDHALAEKLLGEHAKRKGINLTEPAPKTERDREQLKMQTATMKQLQDAHGPAFDRAFLEAMIRSHMATIEMTTNAATSITDAALQGMVRTLIPILEQHRKIASDLLAKTRAAS